MTRETVGVFADRAYWCDWCMRYHDPYQCTTTRAQGDGE